MARILIVLAIVSVAILVYTIVDIAAIPRSRVKHMPKTLWIIVSIFGLVFGSVLWFTLGRARKGEVVPGAGRPLGPDDDPAFFDGVEARRLSREQEARIRDLERQLADLDEAEEPEYPASRGDAAGGAGDAGRGEPDDEPKRTP